MVNLPFFGKKEKPGKSSSTARVHTLSAQGLSEPEIIRELRAEGYSPAEVDTAMKEAIKTAVAPPLGHSAGLPQPSIPYDEGQPPPPGAEPGGDLGLTEFPLERFPGEEPATTPTLRQGWVPPEQEMGPLSTLERPEAGAHSMRRSEIEEIVEVAIEERIRVFEMNLSDMTRKIDDISSRMSALETTWGQMKGVKTSEVEDIRSNVKAYKESISELSSRIEGMERAVKDSLTPMMQSLRSLSETIQTLKADKK